MGPNEDAEVLRASRGNELAALAEDQIWVLALLFRWLTTTCNSGSKGSDAIFFCLQGPAHTFTGSCIDIQST